MYSFNYVWNVFIRAPFCRAENGQLVLHFLKVVDIKNHILYTLKKKYDLGTVQVENKELVYIGSSFLGQ